MKSRVATLDKYVRSGGYCMRGEASRGSVPPLVAISWVDVVEAYQSHNGDTEQLRCLRRGWVRIHHGPYQP